MSRCARCGLEQGGDWTDPKVCSAHLEDSCSNVIDCRNRELANLHSLLRSVTGKLEEAATRLSEIDAATCGEVSDVLDTVNSVLETLS